MSIKLNFSKFSSIEETSAYVSDAIKDIQGVKFDHVSSSIVRDAKPTPTEINVVNNKPNINQVKQDLDNGIMVSRVTIKAMVEYAAELEAKLLAIQMRNLSVEEQ